MPNMSLREKTRKEAKKQAYKFLRLNHHDVVCRVAEGAFGTVLAVKALVESPEKDKLTSCLVAAKVVAVQDSWPGKLDLWKELSHDNIVPLLDDIRLKKSTICFMPLCMTSLQNILNQNEFRRRTDSFLLTKTWIEDVTKGLSYLHNELGLCHLNLQTSNIMIKMDRRAAIGGFGCISTAAAVKYCGLPKLYSPPECWTSKPEESRSPVNGIPYDMWSLGFVAFNTWTNHVLGHRPWELDSWKTDVYSSLYNALDKENFEYRLISTFPKACINDRDISNTHNFIRGLLRYDPSHRPDVSMVLQHALITDGSRRFEDDSIWTCSYRCVRNEDSGSVDSPVNQPKLAAKPEKGLKGWFRSKWRKFKARFGASTPSD